MFSSLYSSIHSFKPERPNLKDPKMCLKCLHDGIIDENMSRRIHGAGDCMKTWVAAFMVPATAWKHVWCFHGGFMAMITSFYPRRLPGDAGDWFTCTSDRSIYRGPGSEREREREREIERERESGCVCIAITEVFTLVQKGTQIEDSNTISSIFIVISFLAAAYTHIQSEWY